MTRPLQFFNFRTKQCPKISVSNIRDIVFSRCSEIKQTINAKVFTVYATIFAQFMAAFQFFSNYIGDTGPSEKFLSVDHPKEDHND